MTGPIDMVCIRTQKRSKLQTGFAARGQKFSEAVMPVTFQSYFGFGSCIYNLPSAVNSKH